MGSASFYLFTFSSQATSALLWLLALCAYQLLYITFLVNWCACYSVNNLKRMKCAVVAEYFGVPTRKEDALGSDLISAHFFTCYHGVDITNVWAKLKVGRYHNMLIIASVILQESSSPDVKPSIYVANIGTRSYIRLKQSIIGDMRIRVPMWWATLRGRENGAITQESIHESKKISNGIQNMWKFLLYEENVAMNKYKEYWEVVFKDAEYIILQPCMVNLIALYLTQVNNCLLVAYSVAIYIHIYSVLLSIHWSPNFCNYRPVFCTKQGSSISILFLYFSHDSKSPKHCYSFLRPDKLSFCIA